MKKILILIAFSMIFTFAMPSEADAGCLLFCKKKTYSTVTSVEANNNVNSNIEASATTIQAPVIEGVTDPVIFTPPVVVNPPTLPVVVAYQTPTYDYNYNYDYNYDYNDRTSPLSASCYATLTSGDVGDTIHWRASVNGGNGDYNITWSGTNSLSGNGTSVSKRYNSEGAKNASIRVRSGNQTLTRNCDSIEIYDYNYDRNYDNSYDYQDDRYYNDYNNYYSYPLTISCSANVGFAPVNTNVLWTAYVSGGNGSNYSYTWNGTDGLRGSSRTQNVAYHSPGPKYASVTVRSSGQTITEQCSNIVTVGVPANVYGYNQPVYTPPTYYKKPVAKTIVKKVQVAPTPTPVVTPEKTANEMTLASLFSLDNVPWGWVVVLIILVLLSMVIYLTFNRNKI